MLLNLAQAHSSALWETGTQLPSNLIVSLCYFGPVVIGDSSYFDNEFKPLEWKPLRVFYTICAHLGIRFEVISGLLELWLKLQILRFGSQKGPLKFFLRQQPWFIFLFFMTCWTNSPLGRNFPLRIRWYFALICLFKNYLFQNFISWAILCFLQHEFSFIFSMGKSLFLWILCGLHEVYNHIMLRPNLFIYLSTRVERLSRGLVSTARTSLFSQPSWL